MLSKENLLVQKQSPPVHLLHHVRPKDILTLYFWGKQNWYSMINFLSISKKSL